MPITGKDWAPPIRPAGRGSWPRSSTNGGVRPRSRGVERRGDRTPPAEAALASCLVAGGGAPPDASGRQDGTAPEGGGLRGRVRRRLSVRGALSRARDARGIAA